MFDNIRNYIPWITTGIAVAYCIYLQFKLRKKKPFNKFIDKDKAKITDVIYVEDFEQGKRLPYCRCWRSKTFPYCDGSHKEYNKTHDDNIGALVIDWKSNQTDSGDKKRRKKEKNPKIQGDSIGKIEEIQQNSIVMQ